MNRPVVFITAAAVVASAGLTLLLLRSRSTPPADHPASAPTAVAASKAPPPDPSPAPASPAAAGTRKAPPKTMAPKPAAPEAPPDTTPASATLNIQSDVEGAEVFIDRQFAGVTPLTARDIAPGQHRINISAPGYDGYADTLDLAPGVRDLVVNFKVVRLDAAIDVVHKHRFGSCKGKLAATPDGIRYDTDDKDDRFTVALTDLQTFQVDYMQKNLRVQPRQGKRYDFTDPEGNADRLFVFHRDVEKARARLTGKE